MIISRLSGGLGNQLFQYATARRLAENNATFVALDLTNFQAADSRPLRLDAFRIKASPISPADLALRADRVVQEPSFGYHPAVMTFPDDVILHGYWQSEKYFRQIRALLRAELAFRDETIMAAAHAQVGEVRDGTVPVVAVHIRRGDYVDAYQGLFHTLSSAWYRAAMAQFPEARFLAVSDDPAWCRAHLQRDRLKIVASDDDLADFALMRACDHHIIANSTFSWWAAWLADAGEPRIIAPDPTHHWFGPRLAGRDASNILPEHWQRLADS